MAACVGNIQLPVIDLKKAKDPAQRLAVARQLVDAMETVGFMFVENVEGFDPDTLLGHTHWFFNTLSPQDRFKLARQQWNPASKNLYRGFFPTQTEEDSFKEGLEICQEWPHKVSDPSYPFFLEPNVWPQGMAGADGFRDDMNRYFKHARDACLEILRLMCLGCGLREDWFDAMFLPDSMSTLRLLRFPTRPQHTVHSALREDDTVITCTAHHDTGILTLLSTFNNDGLQVQLQEDGEWLAVPRRPHSLVVNIGKLLSAISGGRFKATRHRVIDIGCTRFSVPFFLEPGYSADITRVMPRVVDGQLTPPTTHPVTPGCETFGHWLAEQLRRFAEYKDLLGVTKPQG